jgi:hypothetical protein
VDRFTPAPGLGHAGSPADAGVWQRCADIPTPRLNFAAAVAQLPAPDARTPATGGARAGGLRVVVVGGLDAERVCVPTADVYDPETDCWEGSEAASGTLQPEQQRAAAAGEAPPPGQREEEEVEEACGGSVWQEAMVEARWGCCAIATRGGARVDVLGGVGARGAALATTETFDVARRRFLGGPVDDADDTDDIDEREARWSRLTWIAGEGRLPPMRSPRSLFSVVTLGARFVVAMGGQAPGPGRHRHSALPLTVLDCHSLGIYTLILLPSLSFSVEMTVLPRAGRRRTTPR